MLVTRVGDALQEPFWPEGLGINRGFLHAFDCADLAQVCATSLDLPVVTFYDHPWRLYGLPCASMALPWPSMALPRFHGLSRPSHLCAEPAQGYAGCLWVPQKSVLGSGGRRRGNDHDVSALLARREALFGYTKVSCNFRAPNPSAPPTLTCFAR